MLYQTNFKGFAALVLSLLSLNSSALAQGTSAPVETAPTQIETPTQTETPAAPPSSIQSPSSVESPPATPIAPSETPATVTPAPNHTDLPLPDPQQSCEPLALIGGQGSEVTKTVSAPTIPIPIPIPVPLPVSREVRNNWNTDWAVRGGRAYRRYVVNFMPLSNGKFDIEMYLKYSDTTNERFYNKDRIDLNENESFTVEAVPRSNDQPYQVNVMVGGVTSIGERYHVSVEGCL